MTLEEKTAKMKALMPRFVQCMALMAAADGEIRHEERLSMRAVLRKIPDMAVLTATELDKAMDAALDAAMGKDASAELAGIAKAIDGIADRYWTTVYVMIIALADGTTDWREVKFLEALRGAFALSAEQMDAAIATARQFPAVESRRRRAELRLGVGLLGGLDGVVVVRVERAHQEAADDGGALAGTRALERGGELAGVDLAVVVRVDGSEATELRPQRAGERAHEQLLRGAQAARRWDRARRALRERDERLDVIEAEAEVADERDAVAPCGIERRVRDPRDRAGRVDRDAIVDLQVRAALGGRVGARRADRVGEHAARHRDEDDLVVERHLGLEVAVGEARRVVARAADAASVEHAGVGVEHVADARAHHLADGGLARARADRRQRRRRRVQERGRRERVDRGEAAIDERAQRGVLGVAGDRLEARRHDGRGGIPGCREHRVDDDRVGRVGAGLDDADPRDGLVERDVLVAADHDRRQARERTRERAIVVGGLVRQRDHPRAPVGNERARLAHRGGVRRLERRVERPAAEHERIREADAEQADPDRSRLTGRADRDDVARRQRPIEVVHVRREPHRVELADARHERGVRDIVLVVAERDVRDADRVEARDHAAAVVEARQRARREKIPGERDQQAVRAGARLADEGRHARQVVEHVDVVERDDAKVRRHRSGRYMVRCKRWPTPGSISPF